MAQQHNLRFEPLFKDFWIKCSCNLSKSLKIEYNALLRTRFMWNMWSLSKIYTAKLIFSWETEIFSFALRGVRSSFQDDSLKPIQVVSRQGHFSEFISFDL